MSSYSERMFVLAKHARAKHEGFMVGEPQASFAMFSGIVFAVHSTVYGCVYAKALLNGNANKITSAPNT